MELPTVSWSHSWTSINAWMTELCEVLRSAAINAFVHQSCQLVGHPLPNRQVPEISFVSQSVSQSVSTLLLRSYNLQCLSSNWGRRSTHLSGAVHVRGSSERCFASSTQHLISKTRQIPCKKHINKYKHRENMARPKLHTQFPISNRNNTE